MPTMNLSQGGSQLTSESGTGSQLRKPSKPQPRAATHPDLYNMGSQNGGTQSAGAAGTGFRPKDLALQVQDARSSDKIVSSSQYDMNIPYESTQFASVSQLRDLKYPLNLQRQLMDLEMENDRLRAALSDSDPENYFRANGSFTLLSDGQRTFIRNSCTLDILKNAIHIATHRFDAANLYQLEGTAWEKQGPALQEFGSIGLKKEVFDNYPTVRKWSNCFLIYTSLVAGVLGAEIPGIAFSLISFHNRIIDTADKYKWKEAVLPLALHFHKHRLSHGYSNFTATAWDLSDVYLWHFAYGNELYRDGREFVDHNDGAANGAVYECKIICQAGESDNGNWHDEDEDGGVIKGMDSRKNMNA